MPAITDKEIELAILRPALDKALGTDGIPNRILRKTISLILSHLQRLLNSCLNLAYYPHHFKKSITIILRKPSGEDPRDYTSPKAYRPIALLNTLGKALESILGTCISYLVETYGLLPNMHIGGRGWSTEEALHDIVEKVYAGWNKDQVASLLMLDISGAYDHVCQHRLRYNLRKRHLNLQLVDLISSFLSNRVTTIQSNEFTSAELPITCGIPQGSPLSPILFLFYNADLLNDCSSAAPGLSVNSFIDDTTLCAISPSTEENCRLLTLAHSRCLSWSQTHGAISAPSKTQVSANSSISKEVHQQNSSS